MDSAVQVTFVMAADARYVSHGDAEHCGFSASGF